MRVTAGSGGAEPPLPSRDASVTRRESPDPRVESAPVVATYEGLDDLDAAVGRCQCLLELGPASHLKVGCAGGGAEAADVDTVGCAEAPLVAVGVLLGTLLQGREDRATVVVDHDDGEVGSRLVGSEDEPVG